MAHCNSLPETPETMAKQEAELTILYNFYVDCMPTDDMAEVSGWEGGWVAIIRKGRTALACSLSGSS